MNQALEWIGPVQTWPGHKPGRLVRVMEGKQPVTRWRPEAPDPSLKGLMTAPPYMRETE